MDSKIDKILIELRPRLQSANFFISFKVPFITIQSTKINLEENRISIQSEDEKYEINVSDFFKLHTKTLSSLLIKNDYICFRINTNQNKFSSEILDIQNFNLVQSLRLEINLEVGKCYKGVCSNCGINITPKATVFNRILELPSDNLDINDWFCHKHPHKHNPKEVDSPPICFDEKIEEKENSSKFRPCSTDLFYGAFFGLFNKEIIENTQTKSDKFIFCKRCFQYLGLISNDSVKIWYENIKFVAENDDKKFSLFKQESIIENFKFLVRKTINDFNFTSYLGLPPIFKFIFESKKLDGSVYYLLMTIMDHNLDVFKIRSTEENNNLISLEQFKTMKLMYKYEKYDSQPIMDFWLADTGVVHLQISEKMFSTVVRYLDENASYIPDCYRVNLGFYLSYLDI